MEPDERTDRARGPRLDLTIAVSALLISSLAMLASWSQMRATYEQTRVFEEQLSAQVWPYVSISAGAAAGTVHLSIANDGLGPAVMRSLSISIDGKPQHNYVDLLHAVLGPHLTANPQHPGAVGLSLSEIQPGGVLRPGQTSDLLVLRSQKYAATFIEAYSRMRVESCYCSVIPGKCWFASSSSGDPQPRSACPEITDDLLHEKLTTTLMRDL